MLRRRPIIHVIDDLLISRLSLCVFCPLLYISLDVYVHTCVLVDSCVNAPTAIVKPPQDATVNLKENATFTCETNGSDITIWRVNGTTGISHEIHGDVHTDRMTVGNNNLFVLTIIAKAVYNGTIFQCVTVDIGRNPVESENVKLTVQGILHIACCIYVYKSKTFSLKPCIMTESQVW